MGNALAMILLTLTAASESGMGLVLARSGSTEYTVCVDRKATEPERHAAAELARFLGEVSGAAFGVREVEAPPPETSPAILVGPGAAALVIPPPEVARLGQEGYLLRTKGLVLAIAGGRPRGTLYGVYSFLEDELGCRWFTPEVARIPKRETLTVRLLDRTFVPRLELRSTDYPNSRDADWAVRNKLNGPQTRLDDRRGGKIAYGPFVHTFNLILSPEEHFASHPEYFSEVNGKRVRERTQLCLTNPEVLRIAVEKVRGWMRAHPEATIFSVSQNDWRNYCTCRECSQVMEEEGSPAGPYLRFVNAIGEALREEFPTKAIDTLAYQFTRKPPRKTVPGPNVIVRLTSIECCFSHPLAIRADLDRENFAFAQDLRGWGQISDRLYIWDYLIDYAHSLLPFPNLYTLKPNINLFLENGVQGIYGEANYFSRGGEFAELRTWILAKTLWDPAYDTDRAIDEFLDGYYQEAAPALRRSIDLLHGKTRMEGLHFRIWEGPEHPLFTPEVLTRAVGLLEEAKKAVAGKPALLERVRVASLPVAYLRIARLLRALKEPQGRTTENLEALRLLFQEFEETAKKEGLTHVSEGRSYQSWSQEVQAALQGTT